MDIFSQLEAAAENLIQKNRTLERDNQLLQQEKTLWHKERTQLIEELDRILLRIESLSQEDS
jgi:hypothetical protein